MELSSGRSVAEEQLQRFLAKVADLNRLVALVDADPDLRRRLRDCCSHDEVVALAADLGLEIGRRWGEDPSVPRVFSLWQGPRAGAGQEHLQTLLQARGLRLERIHSCGAASPPGDWFDQAEGEWVLLLQGHADLRFSDPDATCHLGPGDMLWIPPRRRHRLERTDPGAGCLWLTLFIDPDLAPSGPLLDPA
jgi:cupin 2 domain-containing protein